MKRFKAIAAMAENRVIGDGNRIPWHLPDDFKWFKKMTTGNVVIMGRRTFESVGKPLPNRETIILSRRGIVVNGTRTINSLDEIDAAADPRDYFICGGAQVYELALPRCSDLYMTHVKGWFDGDIFFPRFENDFIESEVIDERAEFKIVHYIRST